MMVKLKDIHRRGACPYLVPNSAMFAEPQIHEEFYQIAPQK
jgi:hypothetical protein